MKLAFLFPLLWGALSAATAFGEIKIPTLTGPVMDEAGLFTQSQSEELDQQLRSYLSVVQLQVWTVETLEDEAIEALSIRAAEAWKLGEQKKDNGVILLIAKKEHRARIEVGRGLEGDLPDIIAGRIIDHVLSPRFHEGNFFAGTQAACQAIFERLGGKLSENQNSYAADLQAGNTEESSSVTQARPKRAGLAVVLFLASFVLMLVFRGLAKIPLLGFLAPLALLFPFGGVVGFFLLTGASLAGPLPFLIFFFIVLILPRLFGGGGGGRWGGGGFGGGGWGGGSWGGGSSGSSGWSGGGGSFGGGGASGSW